MKRTQIIAEAGVNHNGNVELAKELIDIAAKAGADIVKFQTFKADNLVSKNTEKAYYQKKLTDINESHYEMIKKLELDYNTHLELINHSNKRGIDFLSTPFDSESLKMLINLSLNTIKIPSGEITNLPFLREIGQSKKSVILSTGMSSLKEIKDAVKTLVAFGTKMKNITVLHCNTEYPTPMEDVNLRAMITIQNELGLPTGYSDHTLGIEVPIAAVALGAIMIEKHFTINRNLKGPDHAASLEPKELQNMIKSIRNIEKTLGDGIKRPSQSETKNISIGRKSIIAKRIIKKNELYSINNLTTKRPGTGISPMNWDLLVGRKANKNYRPDELIEDNSIGNQ
tara:strand:+ start:3460 stop:4482 length:1023 start_codon:yes stop_codon:yes gene_type:complete